jgi:hypothetical protein
MTTLPYIDRVRLEKARRFVSFEHIKERGHEPASPQAGHKPATGAYDPRDVAETKVSSRKAPNPHAFTPEDKEHHARDVEIKMHAAKVAYNLDAHAKTGHAEHKHMADYHTAKIKEHEHATAAQNRSRYENWDGEAHHKEKASMYSAAAKVSLTRAVGAEQTRKKLESEKPKRRKRERLGAEEIREKHVARAAAVKENYKRFMEKKKAAEPTEKSMRLHKSEKPVSDAYLKARAKVGSLEKKLVALHHQRKGGGDVSHMHIAVAADAARRGHEAAQMHATSPEHVDMHERRAELCKVIADSAHAHSIQGKSMSGIRKALRCVDAGYDVHVNQNGQWYYGAQQ